MLGLIGCILFGVGAWLPGYVDPAAVTERLEALKAGHGAGYDLTKITVTLFLGSVGVPFLMAGCGRLAELVTDTRRRSILRSAMLLLPVSRLLIEQL